MAFGKTKRQSTYDELELEFIQIDDFTPGIFDDYLAGGLKGSFPEGAAQRTNTFSCCSAPNGGLIPAPRLIASYIENQFDQTNYPTNDELTHITDFVNVPTNVYPSFNNQQFFPSADKLITSFQTDTGATTNLFQIIDVNPVSTAHYIHSVGAAQGSAQYQCNFGTGAYANGGRAITNVTMVCIVQNYFSVFADGAPVFQANIGGANFTVGATSANQLQNYVVLSTSWTVNPRTGVAWSVADIQAFATTNFFNFATPSLGNPNEYGALHFFQIYLYVASGTTLPVPTFNDQSFYAFQWYNNNPALVGPTTASFNQKTKVRTYKFWSNWNNNTPASFFDISNTVTTSVIPNNQLLYGYTALAVSRSNKAAPTVPGNAVVATLVNPWVFDTGVYSALYYPSNTTPATDSTDTLVITGTSAVNLVAHQDRIVAVINSSIQAFGTGGSIGFEEIRATATNNVTVDSGQDAIFVNENPSNIGVLISVNANELVVLKNVGGGYQARGDIGTSPTITRLPGLPPADINHRPCAVPGGMVYGNSQGIWEFRSGDSATPIAEQLDGKFWIPPNTANYLGNRGSFAFLFPFVFVPNGFFYDLRTKGWWRINNSNSYAWASSTTEGQVMLVPSAFSSGQSIADWYDIHQGQSYYSWQSQPIAMTQTRLMALQEHTIVAQPPSGTVGGTITITYEGLLPNGQTTTTNDVITLAPSTAPQAFTNPMSIKGYDLTVRIESVSADGTSPAPRFYRLNLGLMEDTKSRG